MNTENKEKRDHKIFEMWMACHAMNEIAQDLGCSKETVSDVVQVCQKKFHETKSDKFIAEFGDWDTEAGAGLRPIYNVWSSSKTNGVAHFGNSEARWTERLVHMYTAAAFDIVVDPFAGGGPTIDICRRRFRRYWVSDRKPILARDGEIRQWDVTGGPPPLAHWSDERLVFLDPPYWRQSRGSGGRRASKKPRPRVGLLWPSFR